MRVVVGEDETLQREGLTRILEEAGLEVVGAAADAPSLLELVGRSRPDIVVTDIRMPPHGADDGLQAALSIRSSQPSTGVMVLSHHLQRRYAVELLGARPAGVGYLLKQRIADLDRFCADVLRVAEGGLVLDPEVIDLMVGRAAFGDSPVAALTARQREVLHLLAEGRSNAGIAARLGVSPKSVVHQVSGIYGVLGLPPDPDDHRRVLAVVRFLN